MQKKNDPVAVVSEIWKEEGENYLTFDQVLPLGKFSLFEYSSSNVHSLHSAKGVGSTVTRLGDFWTLGSFSKPLATINLLKSPTFLVNFWKGVKIFNISS